MPTARPTFAKPRPRPDPGADARRPSGLAGSLANPYVGAAAAAALFVASGLALVALTGDPKAGAPVVRLSLAKITETSAPPGWREALPAESPGDPVFDSTTVSLSTSGQGADSNAAASGGSAVITIPPDASLDAPQAMGAGQGLPQAPIAGLFAAGPAGPLPVIAPDGQTPARAYARPFASNGKPKVSLIIGGLGLNAKATREAISGLPAEVTLSFVPYSEGLQGWIDMARAAGHEVLLETPMEPKDYPDNDPGPYTLLADERADETTRRLEWLLSRASGYFGLTNYLGSKFVQSPAAMAVFTSDLAGRGLAFIDDGSAARTGGGLPRASANRIVDDQLDGAAIDAQLTALETEASRSGQALGSGFAYPVTLEEASRWTAGLAQRGYQLVPASALATRR